MAAAAAASAATAADTLCAVWGLLNGPRNDGRRRRERDLSTCDSDYILTNNFVFNDQVLQREEGEFNQGTRAFSRTVLTLRPSGLLNTSNELYSPHIIQ